MNAQSPRAASVDTGAAHIRTEATAEPSPRCCVDLREALALWGLPRLFAEGPARQDVLNDTLTTCRLA